MANWYGHARSNYFKVKDEAAFQAWVESVNGLTLITNGEGMFGILSDDCEDFDLEEELRDHLAEGQVAVLMEVGAEKLRYLTGWAVALAWDGRTTRINLEDIYGAAEREFGVMPTLAQY